MPFRRRNIEGILKDTIVQTVTKTIVWSIYDKKKTVHREIIVSKRFSSDSQSTYKCHDENVYQNMTMGNALFSCDNAGSISHSISPSVSPREIFNTNLKLTFLSFGN